MAKVSIIVPVYKTEKYIAQCLNSIIGQTFNDIEIICVNDKTPDKSFEIVKEYAKRDNRIVLIENENNIGCGFSRNNAIDIAKGEYIGFVDADDIIDINYYTELYSTAKKYDVDLVCTLNICNINASKKEYITHPTYYNSKNIWVKKYGKKYEENKSTICIESDMHHSIYSTELGLWNKLWRFDFIKSNNLRFINSVCASDADFFYRSLVHNPTTAYNHRALYYYRIDNKLSLLTEGLKNNKHITGLITAIKNIISYYKKYDIENIMHCYHKIFLGLLYQFDISMNKEEAYKYIHDFFVGLNLKESDFIDSDMYSNYIMFATLDTYREYALYKELKENYENEIEKSKIKVNWFNFFGIYNNKSYIRIIILGISFSIKITNSLIDNLAWFIPVRKWRDNFRRRFK